MASTHTPAGHAGGWADTPAHLEDYNFLDSHRQGKRKKNAEDFGKRPLLMTTNDILTPLQIAKELNISARYVRSWIRAGTLPASKLGPRTNRVSRDDLNAFLVRFKITPRLPWKNQPAPRSAVD